MNQDFILIAGHKFKPVANSTMRHDVFTQGQIEKCGLARLEKLADESPEEFALRTYRTAILSGDVFLLLGCLLMPADQDPLSWSEAMAKETAGILGNAHTPEDKAAIQAQICSALALFFAHGLSSLKISLNSGKPATQATPAAAQKPIASNTTMTPAATPITPTGAG